MPVSDVYSDVVYDISDDEEESHDLRIKVTEKNKEIVKQILERKDVQYNAAEFFEQPTEMEPEPCSSKSIREHLTQLKAEGADRIDLLSDTMEFILTTKFLDMKGEMVDLLGNGKIYKKIVKGGAGECPPPKALLTFHYASFCVGDDVDSETGEPFDSSYLREKPDRKRLGVGSLLPGVDVALATMKRGEESYFLFHPDVAYGERGVPPRILPNCWILFSARLIRWSDCSGATEYERMTEEERKDAPWSKLKAALLNLKECGLNAYKMGDLETAERMFRKARTWLLNARVENEEVEHELQELSARIYRNLFFVLYKRGGERSFKVALTCINDTMLIKDLPKDILSQCHYYKGCILRRFGEHDRSKDSLRKALKISPKDTLVITELNMLEVDIKRSKEEFKNFAKKAINANVDDLPATSAAKFDNEEEELAECLRKYNLQVDRDTVNLIVEKLKEFKAGDAEELVLPDNWGLNVDFTKAVKHIAEMYGLRLEADDKRQVFRVVNLP